MKLVIAAALTLAAGAAAQAQELRWQTRQSEDGVVLAYEQPETDFQPLFLGCRLPERRFTVSLDRAHGVPPGREVPVAFASEAGQVTLRMRAERTELGDMLTADPPFDPALMRVLTEGRTLRITVAGTTDRIPLAGVQPGATALSAACRRR